MLFHTIQKDLDELELENLSTNEIKIKIIDKYTHTHTSIILNDEQVLDLINTLIEYRET